MKLNRLAQRDEREPGSRAAVYGLAFWSRVALTLAVSAALARGASALDLTTKTADGPGDTTAAKADKKEPAKKAAKQDDAKKGQETPPPGRVVHFKIQPFTTGVLWQNLDLTGNKHKFEKYATPPQGFALDPFRWQPIFDGVGYGVLSIKGQPQADYRVDSQLALDHGQIKGEAYIADNRFFDESPVFAPGSNRRDYGFFVRQNPNPNFGISLRYWNDQQNKYFEPPLDALRTRTTYGDVVARGQMGKGTLSLVYNNWHYLDRLQVQPETNVNKYTATYLWNLMPNASLEGQWQHHDINQRLRPDSHIDTLALNGGVSVGPATDVDFNLRRDTLSLPVVQNAYDRERRSGRIQLAHRFPNWTTQVGVSVRENERVNADHTFVDTPRWTTFDGKLYGRIGKTTRVSLRGSVEDLSNTPQFQTDDPRSLYWNNRSRVQLKVDTGNAALNGYFVGTWRRQENNARASILETTTASVGGNWTVTPRLAAFVDFTNEHWHGVNDAAGFPGMVEFTPDSNVLSLGASWVITDRTYLWTSWVHFDTSNDNPLQLASGNTRGELITINLRHRLRNGYELGLVFAPWTYRDSVVDQMNWDSRVVMFTASARY